MELIHWIILILVIIGIWFVLNQPLIEVEGMKLPADMGCQDPFGAGALRCSASCMLYGEKTLSILRCVEGKLKCMCRVSIYNLYLKP